MCCMPRSSLFTVSSIPCTIFDVCKHRLCLHIRQSWAWANFPHSGAQVSSPRKGASACLMLFSLNSSMSQQNMNTVCQSHQENSLCHARPQICACHSATATKSVPTPMESTISPFLYSLLEHWRNTASQPLQTITSNLFAALNIPHNFYLLEVVLATHSSIWWHRRVYMTHQSGAIQHARACHITTADRLYTIDAVTNLSGSKPLFHMVHDGDSLKGNPSAKLPQCHPLTPLISSNTTHRKGIFNI